MGSNTGEGGGGKRPSFHGVAMIDTVRGVPRIRKWPRKRPKSGRKDIQIERETRFGATQRLWRYLAPQMQIAWQEATAGTPFLPRDLYTSSTYGRFARFIMQDDGRKVYSVATREDVSDSLDALSQTLGAILVRQDELWEALDPGQPGWTLQSNGPDKVPAFGPGGGGGGGAVEVSRVIGDGASGGGSGSRPVNWPTLGIDDLGVFDLGADPTIATMPAALDGKLVRVTTYLNLVGATSSSVNAIGLDVGAGAFAVVQALGDGIGGRDICIMNTRLITVATGDKFSIFTNTPDPTWNLGTDSYFQIEGPFD